MKKTESSGLKAAKRPSGGGKTVEGYLAGYTEPVRGRLVEMRALIRSVLPGDVTETISYGVPAFKGKKILVWYGGFKNHCSLFPSAAVIEQFKEELKGFATSKGAIQFPLDKPLPVALIRKLVKARLAQSEGKSQ